LVKRRSHIGGRGAGGGNNLDSLQIISFPNKKVKRAAQLQGADYNWGRDAGGGKRGSTEGGQADPFSSKN